MAYKGLVAALMISVIASPAAAKGSADQKSPEQTSADKRKYCIKVDEVTGSRISRDNCRTKKEWAAEGVEVVEKKSK